ncbi:Fructose-1,6-bisphosphatase class 1 [Candidatus Providencia siddallii]|uniref:Fructose-1,6-bisphosphatase class 1 n=1 Tax=Candidatus Providencia siddallii TaxID=1715285 RepID=A0A0M6W6U0_9GAMM|nr:Fructose-1,6-bisphosphatase class 1 [Candidatus Providencia siddallii]
MQILNNLFFESQQDFPYLTKELNEIFSDIILGGKIIRYKISKPKFINILASSNKKNIQNEIQMKLDQYANKKFIDIFKSKKNIAGIVSEEEKEIIFLEGDSAKKGKYVILLDPIDGSSNIDVNVSIGTIFSIYQRITPIGVPITEADFLQPGNKQIAAGYILYGPSTVLIYSTGYGINKLIYDSTLGIFSLLKEKIMYPSKGKIYSINEGDYNSFPVGVKKYIKFCQEQNKETNRPYTARYTGSFVADFHRNLLKGGIYIYPNTTKYPNGKLRLLYECNPIAFLAEQGGGKASDGNKRILDIIPNKLHQRTPFFVGIKTMVDKAELFINKHCYM